MRVVWYFASTKYEWYFASTKYEQDQYNLWNIDTLDTSHKCLFQGGHCLEE
jgi:hypothetical protein